VHLSPDRTALAVPGEPGISAGLRLTVGCGTAPASGTVRLDGGGLELDPDGPLHYDLEARGHARWDLTVRAQPGAKPGRHFVTAQIAGPDGQALEDAVLVTVGDPPAPDLSLPLEQLIPRYEADLLAAATEMDLELLTPELELQPGEAGEVAVRLRNATASPIRGEAQLVSPFGSWEPARPWVQGFTALPDADATLRFTLGAPPSARPGQHWWAIVKVAYFGRCRFTDPVEVTTA
jgi:hypothetical protein